MQAEVRVAVDIDADADAVWRRAVDWARQREWIPMTRVRHVAGPELGVGTRVVARTGVGGLGFDDPMTVTALDPPRSIELLHTGRVLKGVGAFRVEAAGGSGAGSRFVWWERVEVPGGPLAPLLWRVGGPATRLGYRRALRRFAGCVEGDSGAESETGAGTDDRPPSAAPTTSR